MKRLLTLTLGATACFSELPPSTGTSSTTGATDSMGTSSTTSTGVSSGSSTSSSSIGTDTGSTGGSTGVIEPDVGSAPPNVYAHCVEDADCDPGLFCIGTDGVLEGIEPTGFCSMECGGDPDCPDAPAGSNAIPQCGYYGGVLVCRLTCQNGEMCPVDLECLEVIYPLPELPDASWMGVCS